MKLRDLANKNILILGYGVEGQATERFLKHNFPHLSFGVADKKNGPEYLTKQEAYDLAIKTPGISPDLVRIPYTTATNIFFANTKGITVGVTGTKGKSTTASLIYSMLKQAGMSAHLVGNIGKPMLDELLIEQGADDVYVCELSSYQLADIRFAAHVSLIINLFPEHMDYHGSIEAYWKAKMRMVSFAKTEDYYVFNPLYRALADLANTTKAQAIPFIHSLPFADRDIPLVGEHNKDNVRAAVTVGEIFHIPKETMHQAVKSFHPLPHRLERVGTYKGITFYDDAISTTPESTMCAIKALSDIGTIFLGGQDRGYDFTQLIMTLQEYQIRNVVLFPDSGETIGALLNKTNVPFKILRTADMGEAVRFAFRYSPLGSIVLLSCASPSYSLWKNFEAKGEEFQRTVKKYGNS